MAGFKDEPTDPGAYEPIANSTIAAKAKQSFAASQRGGHGNFMSNSKRQMRLDIMGEGDAPCPTAYADAKPDLVEASSKMPSSNFRSASMQRPESSYTKHLSTLPAPGAYKPNDALIYPKHKPDSGAFSHRSKTERFSSSMLFDRSYSTKAEVGPGTYETRATVGGGGSTMAISAANGKANGRSAGFRSESVRDLNGAFFKNENFY